MYRSNMDEATRQVLPILIGSLEECVSSYNEKVFITRSRSLNRDAVFIKNGRTQVGLSYNNDEIHIVPRGSNEVLDWVDNMLSILMCSSPVGVGRISYGFYRYVQRVIDELILKVRARKVASPNAKIYIEGHSLGGAASTIIASYLIEEGLTPSQVVTFGSPRTGDKEWAMWYESSVPTLRAVNIIDGAPDLVTRVPKSRGDEGYWHVGTPIMIANNNLITGRSMWEQYRLANPVSFWKSIRIISNLTNSVQAHLVARMLLHLKSVEASTK